MHHVTKLLGGEGGRLWLVMETVYFLTCEEERWWFVVGVGPKAV